jgi:AAA15 family ATPase/GTPase
MAKKTSKKNILKNLRIKNFRCFENFELKNLKRVNIFVGDNNSGKSSVLEAVGFLSPSLKDHFRIMGSRGSVSAGQYLEVKNYPSILFFQESIQEFFSLFFKKISANIIEINAEFEGDKTQSDLKKLELKIFKSNKIEKFIENDEKLKPQNEFEKLVEAESLLWEYKFNNQKNSQKIGFSSLGTYDSTIKDFNDYQVIFLADQAPRNYEIFFKWSKLKESANLKESNEIDEKYLKIVQNFEKDIKKIELIKEYELAFRKNDFTVYLEDLGNGFKKFFDILLTIDLASKNNVPTLLCIDEIDNGLYHDKQDVFWEQIGKLCEEKNIQLFATTHSYDSLKSIVRVFENRYKTDEKIDEELAVFRLVKVKNEVRARPFNFSLLNVMAESLTEIR